MNDILEPDILIASVNNNIDVKNAFAVLRDKISDEYDDNPLYANKVSSNAIVIAKKIINANLCETKIDFDNYKSVHNFIVKNDLYLKSDAKNELLNNFK
ncbi:hypothetical protein [Apilactobacillus micheneri]|uniref:hypothetical protein n=1 Tax=Apilactobacillus micheneri TaxID=1899430 RepID=UPI000D50F1EC|nr:hypothetical protein [Apilactobacillus micheneri]GAY79961.1 hypothetical protein NBRC113063_00825 [Apilactobacillus micheneri]